MTMSQHPVPVSDADAERWLDVALSANSPIKLSPDVQRYVPRQCHCFQEAELARRGGVAGDRVTDADRGPVKSTSIPAMMVPVRIRNLHEGRWDHRQCAPTFENARFLSARAASGNRSLSGGDLITLTLRVAAASAAVVNGVIGHCRPSKTRKA